MKNIFTSLSCLLLNLSFFATSQAQSTERFIRIVGNASETFTAQKARISFTLTAVKANSYEKKEQRSVEMIYEEWLSQLEPLGLTDADLKRDFSSFATLRNNEIKTYSLIVDRAENMEKVLAIGVEGLRSTSTIYLFDDPGVEKEEDLAIAAIEDAKRKGSALCARIGKKLGKILNIEDVSSGCCRAIESGKAERAEKKYKVNVTFELID
ncbi:MAG: SIMPL domain-containing protein [Bacteroidota bacterium]